MSDERVETVAWVIWRTEYGTARNPQDRGQWQEEWDLHTLPLAEKIVAALDALSYSEFLSVPDA